MLANCSQVGAVLQLDTMYCPEDTSWLKWLISFPSYGYLLAVKPQQVEAVQALFANENSLFVGDVGQFTAERQLMLATDQERLPLVFTRS